jgi:hypothetical protein
MEVLTSLSDRFISEKRVTGTRWIGGWLDVFENRETLVTTPTELSSDTSLLIGCNYLINRASSFIQ